MIKWVMFAVGSLIWIATCYFFGSMVGLTNANAPVAIAQDECARRVIADAAKRGETIDMMDARFSPECREIARRTLDEQSASAVRKGLLWGIVPVVLIGGLMVMRSRG